MGERTLRITQSTENGGAYRVELRLEGDGLVPETATARFEFEFDKKQRGDLRWYLEDYLQYPQDPAPKVARRVEGEIIEDLGEELFRKVFQSDDDTRDLWATLRKKLDDTRVEIGTSVAEAASIPWELIRDPKTDAALALRAPAFVRTHSQAAQSPELPQTDSGAIRILLVICRPSGDDDVPFRSVATQLIKGLGDQAGDLFQLDVLRPATYARMAQVLREAKAAGEPYHVVHFDGHGMYAGVPDSSDNSPVAEWLRTVIPFMLSAPGEGKNGYLLFEKPDQEHNVELIGGSKLGKLLVETDTSFLVLNACRSAHAEAPTEPETATASDADNVHEQVRAFGSLAQEVMDAGVAGVVAMRYNVYVVTAAQFVADLYATLVQGRSLGESVSMGRKQLAANPSRTISFDPRPLQDWCVPIVYEATPIELFPEREESSGLSKITIHSGESATERGSLDQKLPRPPDAGFFGRDETLLALDRAFDGQQIVLLHAYAGSGKTATAAEFARWYALTGGVEGPVLFTSFETPTPLPRVLDKIGEIFGSSLEQSGIHWLTLDDDHRREVALQVLAQVPVLWIWDNVEPIAGLAKGDTSYAPEERQALADFLRDARETRAKILLTSRRDERAWLGDLPSRIAVPPMPMQERVQLARALAERHGSKLSEVDDWRPLLRFTQGNPLTVTVLVGQALRDGLRSKGQIGEFVKKLRAGEAAFDDEVGEGRTRSLGASLRYGMHAFTDDERCILALLHLFQGFVDVNALRMMGEPEVDWCLDTVRGLTCEAGIALLDRAAEVGLLTSHGGGTYTIHPALPWFFKDFFERFYPEDGEPNASLAIRAFVDAMRVLGNHYHGEYEDGNREVIALLSAEEFNLLHARRLARWHRWWDCVIGAMQGLWHLYDHTGRRGEWRRLVEEIVPDFVDPATDGPLPGRENDWILVTGYRVKLTNDSRDWEEAERLQRVAVDWHRRRADEVLTTCGAEPAPTFVKRLQTVAEQLGAARNIIRTLAVGLQELGVIQREREQPASVEAYEESLAVAEIIEELPLARIVAFNLGTTYKDIRTIRDLDKAEHWYRRSLELHDEQDGVGRGKCLNSLGTVAFERFRECRTAGEPESELPDYINEAVNAYQQALEVLPETAVNSLAVTHNALGAVYGIGNFDRALPHFRKSIHFFEAASDLFHAAQTRFNVSLVFLQSNRLSDAREYARAALRDFRSYGDSAAAEIAMTEKLLAEIEQALAY